jgi:hypothetical protein
MDTALLSIVEAPQQNETSVDKLCHLIQL